jgi:hypothetical protein
MSFAFGGDDPDQVANLTRLLDETRLTMQTMQADMQVMRVENVTLKQRIEAIMAPSDLTRLVVKQFIMCCSLVFCFLLIFEYFSDCWDQVFGRQSPES